MTTAADYDFTSDPIPPAADLTAPSDILDEPGLRFDEVSSDLDMLKNDLARQVVKEPLHLEVETRPGYVAVFDPTISGAQIESWRARSKDARKVDGVDQVKLACLLLANTTVGLRKDGKPLVDGDGDPVTLVHEAILTATGAGRNAAEAVRKFYGDDAHMAAHSDAVMKASGWGEDAQTVDPTSTRR